MYANQTALITGGSSGIGLALARQLAAAGAHVFLLARDAARLDTAADQVRAAQAGAGQIVETLQADVTEMAQVEHAVQAVLQRQGRVDALFNAAGFAHPGPAAELPLEIYYRTMAANFYGTLHATRAVLPGMLANRRGLIVNFSSLAGLISLFGYSAYGASKYAVRGFSDALRMELKPKGIQVAIVFPPDTDTPQLAYENQFKPAELLAVEQVAGATKALTADEVARVTLRDAARGRYQILPGGDSKLFYHLSRLAGGLTYPVVDWMLRTGMRKRQNS